MEVKTTVDFSDKEIKEILVERAKLAVKDVVGGSISATLTFNNGVASAAVIFSGLKPKA